MREKISEKQYSIEERVNLLNKRAIQVEKELRVFLGRRAVLAWEEADKEGKDASLTTPTSPTLSGKLILLTILTELMALRLDLLEAEGVFLEWIGDHQ